MATLREIVSRFSFVANTTPLEKVAKAVDGIKGRLNLLVGVQAVRGLAALTDRFGTMALDLRNAAEAAGLSTDEFQRLGYAAAQSGVAQETMATTLKSINKRLQDARMGSEQAALSFAQAGVPPEALGSFRNAEDALFGLGAALNRIDDPIKRAALSQELLGEQGPKLLGSLRKQSGGFAELARSADAAANVLSGKQLEAMGDAEQALIGLRQQAGSLTSQLAAMFAPAVTKAIKGITSWLSKNREFLKTSFKQWAGKAVAALSFFAGEVYQLALNVSDAIGQFAKWGSATGGFARATKAVSDVLTALAPAIRMVGYLMKTWLYLTAEVLLESFEKLAARVVQVASAFGEYLTAIKALMGDYSWGSFKKALWATVDLLATLGKANLSIITDSIELMSNAIERLAKVVLGPDWKNSAFGQFFDGLRGGVATVGDLLGINANKIPIVSSESSIPPSGNAISDMQARLTPMLPASMVPNQVMAASPNNNAPSTVNAPITVNITGNADTKPVLQAVKEGVAEHFDRVMTQATVSGATVQVY